MEDAEEIANAVHALKGKVQKAMVQDILATLRDGWTREDSAGLKGNEPDPDTWQAGFNAAIAVIEANYVYE